MDFWERCNLNKPSPSPISNQTFKVGALVALTLAALVLMFFILPAFSGGQNTMSINKLADAVQAGRVKSIVVHDDTDLAITLTDGYVHSTKEQSVDLIQMLDQLGVDKDHQHSFEYRVENGSSGALLLNLIITLGPMLIIGWV